MSGPAKPKDPLKDLELARMLGLDEETLRLMHMSDGAHPEKEGAHPEGKKESETHDKKDDKAKPLFKPVSVPEHHFAFSDFLPAKIGIRLRRKEGKTIAFVRGLRAEHLVPGHPRFEHAAARAGATSPPEVILARAIEQFHNDPEYKDARRLISRSLSADPSKPYSWKGDLDAFYDNFHSVSILHKHGLLPPDSPWHDFFSLISKHTKAWEEPHPGGEEPGGNKPEGGPEETPTGEPAGKPPRPRATVSGRGRALSTEEKRRLSARWNAEGLFGRIRMPPRAAASESELGSIRMTLPSRRPGDSVPQPRGKLPAFEGNGSLFNDQEPVDNFFRGTKGKTNDQESAPRPVENAGVKSVLGVPVLLKPVRMAAVRKSTGPAPSAPEAGAAHSLVTESDSLLADLLGHFSLLESPRARTVIGRELDRSGFFKFGENPFALNERYAEGYRSFAKAFQNVQNLKQIARHVQQPASEDQGHHLRFALLRGLMAHVAQSAAHKNALAAELNDLVAQGHLSFQSGGLKTASEQVRKAVDTNGKEGRIDAVQRLLITSGKNQPNEWRAAIRSLHPGNRALAFGNPEIVQHRLIRNLSRRLG